MPAGSESNAERHEHKPDSTDNSPHQALHDSAYGGDTPHHTRPSSPCNEAERHLPQVSVSHETNDSPPPTHTSDTPPSIHDSPPPKPDQPPPHRDQPPPHSESPKHDNRQSHQIDFTDPYLDISARHTPKVRISAQSGSMINGHRVD